MECSCVIDGNDGYGFSAGVCNEWRTARKQHKCCECNKAIRPGEKYKYEVNRYEDGLESFKTCVDCLSVRETLFCSFIYGEIWEAVNEEIRNGGITESCLSKMTKRAREDVCEMIEEHWERG